jgi:hypothetical protein
LKEQFMNSPYANYPKLGFLDQAPRGLIGRLSSEEAAKIAGLDIKQAVDDTLYDTKYFKAGAALPTSDIVFFAKQKDTQDNVVNDATIVYTKSEMETNLVQAAQLQRGEIFLIESMQALVVINGNLDLTQQGSGNTTLPATLPTDATATAGTSGVVMSNLHTAICKAGVCRLKIGSNGEFEGGPLYQFPSEFGASGFASNLELGTVTAGSNISVNDGVINNGFGRARMFRTGPRLIVAGQRFAVNLKFYNAFTPSRAFDIQFILKGLRFKDVV